MSEALDFLNTVYGDKPAQSFVQLWHRQTKFSYYHSALEDAAVRADSFKNDLYVCVGFHARQRGMRERGTADQIAGLMGLCIDIDVNGGPTNKTGAAPSIDEARELAFSVLEPTLMVNSGYGLQPWYLFEEPWTFDTVEEREHAAQVVAGFHHAHKLKARERGWTIDSTHELNRVFRLPGTFNAKGEVVAPVTIFEPDHEGPRYDLAQVVEVAREVKLDQITREPVHTASVQFTTDASPPAELLTAALENDPAFKQTWEGQHKFASQSEADLSLASKAVGYGFSDQQIADLLVAFRRKSGKPLDAKGGNHKPIDYLKRTVERSHKNRDNFDRKRQREEEEKAESERRGELIEELAQVTRDAATPASREQVLSMFGQVMGMQVKEYVQSNLDPKTATCFIVLADGTEIPLGGVGDLLNADSFGRSVFAVTGELPPLLKRVDYRRAINALGKARTVRNTEVTQTTTQVIRWLREYIDVGLTADANEAGREREPFKKKEHIYVYPANFHDHIVRRYGARRIKLEELVQTMERIGFEKTRHDFYTDDDKKSRSSERNYYRCALDALADEEVSDEPDES